MKKMSFTSRSVCLSLLALMLLTLTACGPTNYVRLHYASTVEPARVQPNAPAVTVVEFADGRTMKDVGLRRDETPFIPVSSVSAWVSEALEQELSRKGLQTRYVKNTMDAEPGEHVVTGTVLKVWLRQKTLTDYTVSIEAAISLNGNLPTTYRAEEERQVIPTSDTTEKQLTEALRSLLAGAVQDITAKVYNTAE